MSISHYWNEDNYFYEEVRDRYINDMAYNSSLSKPEADKIQEDSDYLSPRDFCEKYDLP